jgi:hypothetical protein
MTDESLALEQPYEIVSVRRAKPPPGTEGSNWHRYVIAFEGRNSIHGYRQGNLTTVTRAVEEIVAQLNERHLGKPSRAHLALKKKPQQRGLTPVLHRPVETTAESGHCLLRVSPN